MLQTAMRYSHTLLQEVVKPGQTVVDATMGNGHDTELKAKSMPLIFRNKQ